MEDLGKLVVAAIVVLLAVAGGGLWLMHTAINDGNVWKSVVAGGMILGGVFTLLGAATAGR